MPEGILIDQKMMPKKIGEVPENEEKYSSWSGTSGYYKRLPTERDLYKTDKMLSSTVSVEDLLLNKALCTKMSHTNKSQVEFKPKSKNTQLNASLTRSNSFETFVNHKKFYDYYNYYVTQENFQYAFMKYKKSYGSGLNSDVLAWSDIDTVVKECLNNQISPDRNSGRRRNLVTACYRICGR